MDFRGCTPTIIAGIPRGRGVRPADVGASSPIRLTKPGVKRPNAGGATIMRAESCLSGPVQPGFTDSGLSSPHAFDDWSVLVFHPWIVISAVRLFAALLFVVGLLSPSMAQQTERRIALVIGNSSYSEGPLSAPANDAGLVAQTLQAAGFDVVGARDLDGESLRRAIRDFVDKAGQSGPDTVATVYFAGYGLQFDGENYIVPVDARITRAGDVPIQAIRVADILRPLAAQQLKARIVILDAARQNPFARSGPNLAGGLALMDADPGTLVAFNAAPGTVAPESQDPYGPYARALAEMIRQGGLSLNDVFGQVRLRVSETTNGAMVPWEVDRVDAHFMFFERAPDAPPPNANQNLAVLRDRPLRELDVQQAYEAAIERDTIQGYQEFISVYPRDPLSRRVRALLAARREAITWRRTWQDGTPRAYWSYLRRYPHGPHSADAERRLNRLAAAISPPQSFEVIEYDVQPPPPDEIVYFERPVLMFADPSYDLPPPPRFRYLEPIPTYFVELPPPPPPVEVFVLPQPIYEPVPVWIDRPSYVAPPPVNLISYNIHNTVVVNNVTNTVVVTNPAGQTVPPLAGAAAAGVAPQAAVSTSQASGAIQGAPLIAPGSNGTAASSSSISPGLAAGVGAVVGAGAAAAAMRIALPPSVAAKAPPAAVRPASTAPGTPSATRPAPAGTTALPNGNPGAPQTPGAATVQAPAPLSPASQVGSSPAPNGAPAGAPKPGTPAPARAVTLPPTPGLAPTGAPGVAATPVPGGAPAIGAKPAGTNPATVPVPSGQANAPVAKPLPIPGVTAPPAPGAQTLAPKPPGTSSLPAASLAEPQSKPLGSPSSPAPNSPLPKPPANAGPTPTPALAPSAPPVLPKASGGPLASPATPSVTAPSSALPHVPAASPASKTLAPPSAELAKPLASPAGLPPSAATLPRHAVPPAAAVPALPHAAPLPGVHAPGAPPSPVVHGPSPTPAVRMAPPPSAAPPPVVRAPASPPPSLAVRAARPLPSVVHAPPAPPSAVHVAPPPPPAVAHAMPPPVMRAPAPAPAAQQPHPAAPGRPSCGGAGQAACPK